MSIKDRFLDYWNTDLEYEDYKYDLSIFEQMVYGISGALVGIACVLIIVLTIPLWAIPFLVCKFIKTRNRSGAKMEGGNEDG